MIGCFVAESIEQGRIQTSFAGDAQNIANSLDRSIDEVIGHLRGDRGFLSRFCIGKSKSVSDLQPGFDVQLQLGSGPGVDSSGIS